VDLLFINNFLKNNDGLILAKDIRTNPSITQPKIILMCGLGIEVPDDLIQQSGIDALVNRPLTRQNLANSIVRAIKPDLILALQICAGKRVGDVYYHKILG
jgi:hypothetical protein